MYTDIAVDLVDSHLGDIFVRKVICFFFKYNTDVNFIVHIGENKTPKAAEGGTGHCHLGEAVTQLYNNIQSDSTSSHSITILDTLVCFLA